MLTIVVPTFNNEQSIGPILKAAKRVSGKIMIIDSFSTDKTVEIANKHGAELFRRKYDYSADQKNWALEKVQTEWTMVIDSDELLSDGLIKEIRQLIDKGIPNEIIGFRIPFVHFLWGRPITSIGDRKIKLFRTSYFRFEDKLVHAHPKTELTGRIEDLRNPVYHYGVKSLRHWFQKMNVYSTWDSIERSKKRRTSIWEIIIKPPLFFVKVYIKGEGIFHGFRGFVWSIMQTIVFLQLLLKHYELQYQLGDNVLKLESNSLEDGN